MTSFKILENPHIGRKIDVTYYAAIPRGASIIVLHDVPVSDTKQLRWVQTITSNGETSKICGYDTWVDPFDERYSAIKPPGVPQTAKCGSDDDKPFFATDEEHRKRLEGSADGAPGFYDPPQRPRPATGQTRNEFVTALVEVQGKSVHHLVAVSWGFVLPSAGETTLLPLARASSARMVRHGRVLATMYPGYSYT